MQLTTLRENFLKVMGLVAQAVSPRPNLPVLANFLLEADAGHLTLTGTNLETTIKHRMAVKVSNGGKTTVSARLLQDFCQSAAGDNIELKMEKDNLLVEVGNAVAKIPVISPQEFPSVGQFDPEDSISIDKKDFIESMAQTAMCAAPEEGRPVLTGVLLNSDGKTATLVATDGYRLAKKELKAKGTVNAIIPSRALREGAKAISEQADEEVKISINKDKNQLQLETKNLSLLTRLIDGAYPNYEQIIPASFVSEITVNTKEFADAIKLTALFARDVGNVVRLDFSSKNVTVSARTTQVGEAQTTIATKHKGDKMQIAFNSRFLSDCLSALSSRETSISLSGLTSAALIKGANEKDLIYIVMPVRTQG
ncbi:MAG: DNA polymerase III subunit beta [Candidatus Woykebacteria bacterium RBG_16_43_9]|uniref:Beta sliding clamp n=1 Tax=Candidatus Woykebacteria bacterium RBG_16_43_9 TaxID=1802596 RepID=A0A1G1WCX7_9BACT|nr:MAG: DNA polymerase III subunit beta [Candidatus Woykebacteria bacterium RBG_16_43_9]